MKPPNRHMLMVYGLYGICTVVLFTRAAADQSLQMPAPHSALAFMHVFKAGGTTFGVVLAKYAKAHGIPFYTDMRQGRQLELPSYILSLNKRARHLAVDAPKSKNFSIFHGHLCDLDLNKLNFHHHGAFDPFLGTPGPLFVVTLREPAARLLAAFLQLTAGLRHKKGARLSMDPKSLQGGTMDKERLGEMFKEFMEQQNVAQCRIVPNQVFGSRWAAPCAPYEALDPKRLRGMKKLLARKAILPLITERHLETAALLDLFLAKSGYKRPPSILQFFEHGQDFRCGNHENWRHGRYHSGLEECRQNKGRVNQAGLLLTHEMRQTVLDFMGYELWFYNTSTLLFDEYVKVYDIDAVVKGTKSQEFSCGGFQSCRKFFRKWGQKPKGEIAAEIRRLKEVTKSSFMSSASEIKALRKVAMLKSLSNLTYWKHFLENSTSLEEAFRIEEL